MAKQDDIREKLEKKVFNVFGKTVTFKSKDSPTYNDRGEEDTPTYTESSIIIVPYNIVDKSQTYEAFGALQGGDMDAAVPYSVDIDVDDVIVIETVNWIVKAIDKNYLPENVVTIVRLVKEQS